MLTTNPIILKKRKIKGLLCVSVLGIVYFQFSIKGPSNMYYIKLTACSDSAEGFQCCIVM